MFHYDNAVRCLLLFGMIFLSVTMLLCLICAIRGPKQTDRIIATNMIGAKTILLIVIVGIYIGEGYLVDVALIYAMLNFFAVVVFTKLILQSELNKLKERRQSK